MKFKTKEVASIICCSILTASLMSCTTQNINMSENTSNSFEETPITTNYITENTTETEETTTESIEQIPQETVFDRTEHMCPIPYNDENFYIPNWLKMSNTDRVWLSSFGFDNPELREHIRERMSSITGTYDEDLTIDNIHYLCYLPVECDGEPLSEEHPPGASSYCVRTILAYYGYRYYIDEIPSAFFEQFPEEWREYLRVNGSSSFYNNFISPDGINCSEMNEEQLRALAFLFAAAYNTERSKLIYRPYSVQIGQIVQERNPYTGQLELVPTEEQLEILNNDVYNSALGIPDITVPETLDDVVERSGTDEGLYLLDVLPPIELVMQNPYTSETSEAEPA